MDTEVLQELKNKVYIDSENTDTEVLQELESKVYID